MRGAAAIPRLVGIGRFVYYSTKLGWLRSFESWLAVVSGFCELVGSKLEYFFAYCTMMIVFDDTDGTENG